MTDDIRRMKEDISFMKGLVKDDGSVLHASGIGLAVVGIVFGLAALRSFALAEGWLHWPEALRPLMPWDATVVFLLLLLTLLTLTSRRARTTRPSIGAVARTVWASWAAVGIGYAVAAASFSLAGAHVTGGVLFAFWGGGWLVAATAYRRGTFAAVSAACYAVAIVSGLLADTAYDALLLGGALLVLVALPGLMILRQARRGT